MANVRLSKSEDLVRLFLILPADRLMQKSVRGTGQVREVIQAEDWRTVVLHLLRCVDSILQNRLRHAVLAARSDIALRAPAIHLPLDSALAEGAF
ncbi:hypothetical protein D3C84_1088520 [compost metagenome]